MAKTLAPRKRYVLFYTPRQHAEKEFSHTFLSQAMSFFGEYGSARTSLKIIEYDGTWGILRCSRNQVQTVLGFCALLTNPRVIAKASSGTIKSLNERRKAWERRKTK